MRFFTLFFILLITDSSAFANTELNGDGESLFLSYQRRVQNRPNNFDDYLRKLLTAGTEVEQQGYDYFLTAVIPRGRSLQRNTVRQLRAFVFKRGATFIGYSPANQSGEVISWNPHSKHYDFLEFSHFGEDNFEIRNANRSLCLSCHQGGGPIFPRAPWSELVEEKNFEKFGGLDEDLLPISTKEREEQRFLNHHFFDEVVRNANLKLQITNSCSEICSADLLCRRELLLATLNFHDEIIREEELERFVSALHTGATQFDFLKSSNISHLQVNALQKVTEPYWPEHGFAVRSSTIPDRNPTEDFPGYKIIGTLKNGEDPNFSDGFSEIAVKRFPLSNNPIEQDLLNYQLKTFASEPLTERKLGPNELFLADPKHMRPLVNQIPLSRAGYWAFLIAPQCLSMRNNDLYPFLKYKRAQIEKAVRTRRLAKALCQWPANKEAILEALQKTLHGLADIKVNDSVCAQMPNETKGAAQILSNIQPTNAIQAFQKYCSKCHSGNTEFPLHLSDIDFLRNYKGLLEPSPKYTLENNTMPPPDSPQPTAKEARMMIKALTP